MSFPLNIQDFTKQSFSLNSTLDKTDLETLKTNIQLIRDTIVFFTAIASKRGFGGHTGGAYDMIPEALILQGFMNDQSNKIHPVLFDEAGHRVALQYVMAVINGHMSPERLYHYREFNKGLYGHPERDEADGIFFSSGRLGHLWSHVNGLAEAYPDTRFVLLGSDGSQMEGDDAEAARYCVSRNLKVSVFVDDNNVTISGHPKDYMKGYSVQKTLEGHGVTTQSVDAENVELLYDKIKDILQSNGPSALLSTRIMAPGIPDIEGTPKGHDVVPVDSALDYLNRRGLNDAVLFLDSVVKHKSTSTYLGSSEKSAKNRSDFGKILSDKILAIPENERREKIIVVDSDLEGSCGLNHIRKNVPEVFVAGGIMERNNFSVAAGFGSTGDKLGVFATFSAFAEMIISELTMARLNHANMLIHFSHSGIDDMADNTCHFGLNNFFLDNGVEEGDNTKLYYPADSNQLKKIMDKTFDEKGIRFIFSTRSAVPYILKEDGSDFFDDHYTFTGNDEIIREGKEIYIVSTGDMLYRSLDAVEKLKKDGIDAALINKPVLNLKDTEMLTRLSAASVVIVTETFNSKTGLGIRFGTWLLEHGYKGKYAHLGTSRLGRGGLFEHIPYQGLDPDSIMKKVKSMV
jgi:transketolase